MFYDGKIIADGPPEEFRHSSNEVVAQFVEGRTEGPILDRTRHYEASPDKEEPKSPGKTTKARQPAVAAS
jgi:hypothetical protein